MLICLLLGYLVGEGMPIWKSSIGEKGDLIIQFDIAFPTQLSLANRGKLKEILK